ncbi:MAG: glycosyltransferase [Lachnospiraceae bacterium]|nr:glycosyltransferase [Lachnospiraceae bacterium]
MAKKKIKKEVLVSVIIPVYNVEKYIEQCLDSVLNQKMKNIEVICIDDCSTDNSFAILKKYEERDSRVKVIRNSINRSAGASRNTGIEMASGKYIHFLDSDDWVEEEIYQKAYGCIEESGADVCIFLCNKYDNVSDELASPVWFPYMTGTTMKFEENYRHFFNTAVVPWNKLFRAEFIKQKNIRFDEITCANDRTFYFSSITQAEKITFLKEHLINYRVNNAESLVGQARRKHYDCHFESFYNSRSLFNDVAPEIKNMFLNISAIDILSFYHKIDLDEKVRKDVSEFVCQICNGIESNGGNLAQYAWSAEAEILRITYEKDLEKVVPIVFATNNNYAPYMAVAIDSLIENIKEADKEYCIFVLYSELEDRYISTISKIARDNAKIYFVNVDAKIDSETKSLYSRAHYSKEMYYRILIPDLFRMFKTVLYLDCDIILKEDAYRLYKMEIGDNILGGVVNASSEKMGRYIQNQLHIPVEQYINSGILLFNCEEFRNQYIKERCFGLVNGKKDYVCPDQDILNIACKGNIYYLSPAWNFQWYKSILMSGRDEMIELVPEVVQEYEAAEKTHYILHFTSGIKAWNSPDRKNAYLFWEYAERSSFYTEIKCKNFSKLLNNAMDSKAIGDLRKKNRELEDKLRWNRDERERLAEENKSLLVLLSSKLNQNEQENKKISGGERKRLIDEIEDYKYQIEEIRKSWSFKLGRFFTFIPRKIRGLMGGAV